MEKFSERIRTAISTLYLKRETISIGMFENNLNSGNTIIYRLRD
jgi:hypothetical protein